MCFVIPVFVFIFFFLSFLEFVHLCASSVFDGWRKASRPPSPSMLLNTRPRVFWNTLHLAWIALLLQDGARAFAPPPQALQWRPAACAVSARGGQRAIGTLRAGDVKNEALSESQPTSVHAHQGSKRAAKPGTAKLEAVLAPCLEVQSPAPVQLEEKPAVDTRRFWRLVATVGAALALSVSTPAPSFAKGGGGASGGGGGGGHFHSRSYSRASRSSNVGVFLDDADDEHGDDDADGIDVICADGDSASAPGIVALFAAAGGAALLDNLDSTATARAPSRPKRLMLTEGERRSWVVASTPLSSHAAQTRSAKGLSGSYRAEYVERGVTGKSAYRLCFADGRVTGMGWDADGDFQVLFVLNLVLVLLGIGSRAGPSSFLPYSLFPCPFCAAL